MRFGQHEGSYGLFVAPYREGPERQVGVALSCHSQGSSALVLARTALKKLQHRNRGKSRMDRKRNRVTDSSRD